MSKSSAAFDVGPVKVADLDPAVIAAEVRDHLTFASQHLGARIPIGARVLDFGCGIGHSVAALLDFGYDAHGVDIAEFWNRDYDQYWGTAPKPAERVASRLQAIDSNAYRLPFADRSFDFIFSDQVMEHVTDHGTVFAELARVLKPGALSLHRFPGPNRPMENHLQLPVPLLCHSRAYLTLWALAGKRNMRQKHMDWRQTVADNMSMMRGNRYPTKGTLRRIAAAAGVEIQFVERQSFRAREGGGLKPVYRLCDKLGAGGLFSATMGLILQRYMVLRGKPGA